MKYLFLLLLSPLFLQAQQLEDIYPSDVKYLEFHPEWIQKYNGPDSLAKRQAFIDKWEAGDKDYEKMSQEERTAFYYCTEFDDPTWDVIDRGCSWYCGAEDYKVSASSSLAAQESQSYEAQNVDDFTFQTAWAEGIDGDGIGESLLFTFPSTNPRLHTVIIGNGYVKSAQSWKNNNRVKRLKMYVDGEAYAILHLEDKRAQQSFKVKTIGHDRTDRDKLATLPDWTIKLEILEVYSGDKYQDTVISDIAFDGIDVH